MKIVTDPRQVGDILAKAFREIPDAVASELTKEAGVMLALARSRTPIKTGALKRSGRVEPVKISGNDISVNIRFGGGDSGVGYAWYVHEDLHARHQPPFGKGGQAKFLDSAVKERGVKSAQLIANRLLRNYMSL